MPTPTEFTPEELDKAGAAVAPELTPEEMDARGAPTVDRASLPPPYNVAFKGKNPGVDYQPPLIKEDPLSYVIGGGAGKLTGKLGQKALAGATPLAMSIPEKLATSVVARSWDKIARAIDHTAEKSLTSALAKEFVTPVANVVAKAGEKIAGGAARFGVAALPAAGIVAGAAIGGTADRLGTSVMSNAIDRLRASAASNPRAADLLSKIEAMHQSQFPAPVQTGTVSQGTLGGHE